MIKLANLQCSEYSKNEQPLNEQQIDPLINQISNWQVINDQQNTTKQLYRLFKFADYQSAVNFTNQVAQMAEQQNHHPDILLSWGKVTISWWTHKVNGLHKNDFICAAKCDEFYNI